MNQCYYSGEFYQYVGDGTPGQSPASSPTAWRKIQIPKKWRFALSLLAYSNMLKLDGQADKANNERALALQTEHVGLDDLVRTEATSERWLERPSVQVRGPFV